MKEHVSEIRRDVSLQLRHVLEDRSVTTVFQPIFGFREGRIIGFEALVRGPEGSLIETPGELFAAATVEGVAVELNILCIKEILRAFVARKLEGSLFLNVSPQLIMQRGFDRERAERFLRELGLAPERVVIELTEDYPTVDFRLVHESLMLYRSMGFRVAIDDLGEGFSSLRLWSELKPEFVKADKHFVTGLATDPVKLQFLRAIQHIAEKLWLARHRRRHRERGRLQGGEGHRRRVRAGMVHRAPGGMPQCDASRRGAARAGRCEAAGDPAPRLRAGSEPTAHDFVRAVDAAVPHTPVSDLLVRFAANPALAAIPVIGASGVEGVVSRSVLDLVAASGASERLGSRPCVEFADRAPIHVEAELDLTALTAILVESDARRLADGFVIASHGRYLGMGTSGDVMRSLQSSRVLAARYTNPLTLLPGQVPINEHLERLLAGKVPFTAWFAEFDQMRGLNDSEGFATGDAVHPRRRAPARIGMRARHRFRGPRGRKPLRGADAKRRLDGARRAHDRKVSRGARGATPGASSRARLLHREAPGWPRLRAAAAAARGRHPAGAAGRVRVAPRGRRGGQARRGESPGPGGKRAVRRPPARQRLPSVGAVRRRSPSAPAPDLPALLPAKPESNRSGASSIRARTPVRGSASSSACECSGKGGPRSPASKKKNPASIPPGSTSSPTRCAQSVHCRRGKAHRNARS